MESFGPWDYLSEGPFYLFITIFHWVGIKDHLDFSPTVLRITSLLELRILVSSWIISVQNSRSRPSENFWMQYYFLVDPYWINFSRDRSHFAWDHIPLLLLRPLPVSQKQYWFTSCICLPWNWGINYQNNSANLVIREGISLSLMITSRFSTPL